VSAPAPAATLADRVGPLARLRLSRRQLVGRGLAAALLGPTVWTASSAADWSVLPFSQKLDMAVVRAVVRTPPGQLLAAIDRRGVRVLRVRTAASGRPVNPVLAPAPLAEADLLLRAEFLDRYEGRVVLRGDPFCEVPRDTILIRDTATTYTLLHEFLHTQLRPVEACRDDVDTELRFTLDYRRLQTYQRRVYDDPYRLLLPQWRDDLLQAQTEVVQRLYRRLQIGHSQEAIIEKVLAATVDERNPHFDAARRAEGLRYGEAMIDNAIDLHNAVDAAIAFVRDTVRHLREDVRAGVVATAGPQRLDDGDVARVDAMWRQLKPAMARVRAEIEALKRFYAA
jgi:hypothetical protein